MNYSLMTDEDIMKDLAEQYENLRIKKQLKETDIQTIGGISRKTLYNFRQGTTAISLKSFIRLLRAIDQVDRLQSIFPKNHEYSPLSEPAKNLPKRVRVNNNQKKDFTWGDEQ